MVPMREHSAEARRGGQLERKEYRNPESFWFAGRRLDGIGELIFNLLPSLLYRHLERIGTTVLPMLHSSFCILLGGFG